MDFSCWFWTSCEYTLILMKNNKPIYIDCKSIRSSIVAAIDDHNGEYKNNLTGISGINISSLEFSQYDKDYLRKISLDSDIEFILEKGIKDICFYAVPYVDIFAFDSEGGWYAVENEILEYDSNIIYIAPDREAYKIGMSFGAFINEFSDISESYTEFTKRIKYRAEKSNTNIFESMEAALEYVNIVTDKNFPYK